MVEGRKEGRKNVISKIVSELVRKKRKRRKQGKIPKTKKRRVDIYIEKKAVVRRN